MQVKLLMGASFDVASREVSGDQTGRMLESKGCKGKTMITKRVEKGEHVLMVSVEKLRMRMATVLVGWYLRTSKSKFSILTNTMVFSDLK